MLIQMNILYDILPTVYRFVGRDLIQFYIAYRTLIVLPASFS